MTLNGSAEGALLTGYPNSVTFTGAVSPADVGARVILQRQNALTGNQWRRIDSGFVESTGDYTITHTFVVPGDANLRVLVHSQGRNVPSESNILADTVSQAQNPELTIQASADPIASGEAVTISGKLTAGASRSLTLMAHTARQPGFVAVARTTGNSAGESPLPGAVAGQQRLLQGGCRPARMPAECGVPGYRIQAGLLGGPLRGREGRTHRSGLANHDSGGPERRVLGHSLSGPNRSRDLPRTPERTRDRGTPRGSAVVRRGSRLRLTRSCTASMTPAPSCCVSTSLADQTIRAPPVHRSRFRSTRRWRRP